MKKGDRVLTPKGTGRITAISDNVKWAFGDPIRESLITVELDAAKDGLRPVFYARDVTPEDEDSVEVEIEITEP